jgi:signal peptidase
MRTATRVIGKCIQGVAIVAALGAATVLVVPRLLGWQTVTVMSGSMTPAYRVNAVLAIKSVDPTEIQAGDVIAFETEADRPMVTHRVVAVEHDALGLSFITKGDANEDADSTPVAASAVRGRVVFGVPYLGLFVRAVNNTVGFGLLVIVPAMVLIVLEILTIRRDRRAAHAQPDSWPAPEADDLATTCDDFDFWTTPATEDRYYEELGREVGV